MRPVWPDARMKSSPIFTKVAQIGAEEAFYAKRYVFTIAQKVAQYLSLFCKRICLQDFSKVAQSGHTAPNLTDLLA